MLALQVAAQAVDVAARLHLAPNGSGQALLQFEEREQLARALHLGFGIGTCGKNGQGVPVGVGQPTMLIDRLTVGGTAT